MDVSYLNVNLIHRQSTCPQPMNVYIFTWYIIVLFLFLFYGCARVPVWSMPIENRSKLTLSVKVWHESVFSFYSYTILIWHKICITAFHWNYTQCTHVHPIRTTCINKPQKWCFFSFFFFSFLLSLFYFYLFGHFFSLILQWYHCVSVTETEVKCSGKRNAHTKTIYMRKMVIVII